jgi:hypothetical protein
VIKSVPVLSVLEASVKLVEIIENATREGQGGQYVTFDGESIPW